MISGRSSRRKGSPPAAATWLLLSEVSVVWLFAVLELTDGAQKFLADRGYDPVYGARPLKRAIQQQIENPIAKLVLEGRAGPKDVVPVTVQLAGVAGEQGVGDGHHVRLDR